MLIILGLFLIIPECFCFEQNDYLLTFERLELTSYNKEYIKAAKITTFKYNRTQAVVNASFEIFKDLGNDLELIMQTYTFVSNEYRMFPIHLGVNFCNTLNANDFGLQSLIQKGAFNGCPINKGIISVYNWKPDASRFPPFIPNGQYKLEVHLMYTTMDIGTVSGYGTIYRPLGRRH